LKTAFNDYDTMRVNNTAVKCVRYNDVNGWIRLILLTAPTTAEAWEFHTRHAAEAGIG
jgi:hypothetical protein